MARRQHHGVPATSSGGGGKLRADVWFNVSHILTEGEYYMSLVFKISL